MPHALSLGADCARLPIAWGPTFTFLALGGDRGWQARCTLVHHRALMRLNLPPIGSKWVERDNRKTRTIEVIRYDTSRKRVRIHCIETETLSWAKPERFNGKSGGYQRSGG
jgi:hypothetical protein